MPSLLGRMDLSGGTGLAAPGRSRFLFASPSVVWFIAEAREPRGAISLSGQAESNQTLP